MYVCKCENWRSVVGTSLVQNAKRAEECGGMDKRRGKRAPRQRNKPGTFKRQVRVCG